MHATYEIVNCASRLIIRATRIVACNLLHEIMNTRKGEITFHAWLVVHQDARYVRNRELCIEVNYSCNKNRSVQLVARNREYTKGLNNVPCVVWSCIKMHATYEIVNCASRLIIRATRIVACNLLHEIMNTRKGEITFHAWFGLKINRTLM